MTKLFRRSGYEYQRSPKGSPNGVLSNPLARVTGTNGAITVNNEAERRRLVDTAFGAFVAATHEGRLITLRNTPPASGSVDHGSQKLENWTFRIVTVVDVNTIELEGVRFDDAGTGIEWTIHAAVDFTAATGNFPEDTGPSGTDADGENRANEGPVEWQEIAFPNPANTQLRIYPFTVSRRTSATVLRLSDQFDQIQTFPIESSLIWSLRDRTIFTHEQFYKVAHMWFVQSGWDVHQSRGKNNGAGVGGNNNDNVYVVHDTVYFSDGEDGSKVQYLRFAAFHRMSNDDGTDSLGNWGFDFAFFSAWDRDFAPVDVTGGGTTDTNQGNGINSLSCHVSASSSNRWAAQADSVNTSSNNEPWFSPDSSNSGGSAFGDNVRWGSPYHQSAAARDLRANTLNTPEGGDLSVMDYVFFGSKDECHIFVWQDGYGSSLLGLGSLSPRADSNANNFVLQASIAAGSNVLARIGTTNPASPPSSLAYQVGDSIQLVGQQVNAGIVPTTSHAGEFIESTTISALPGEVVAVGFIDAVQGNDHVDGELLTIDDGEGNSETFEYDDNVSVTGGNVSVDMTGAGATSDTTMASRLAAAINGTSLNITATPNGSRVDLAHGTVGTVGNVSITNTVADAGYVVEGMVGGGYAIELSSTSNSYAAGALVGEDPQPLFFFRAPQLTFPFQNGSQSATNGGFRLSNRSRNNNVTYFDHNGPSGSPPNVDGFNAYPELEGIYASDFTSMNPNERTGKHGLVTIAAKDTDGGQMRGRMRLCRAANARIGSKRLIRDRNGDYHYTIPLGDRFDADGNDESTFNVLLAYGPIPVTMTGIS